MESGFLSVEHDGPVTTVTLNRPNKLNALSLAFMGEIETLAGELSARGETRAVVFTGAGKHFSAGADLKDPDRQVLEQATTTERQRRAQSGQKMVRALLEMRPITIAAINGGAIGGAACMVTALDFRLGTPGTFVAYPEIDLGMNLSWYGLPLCLRLVGPARAKRIVIGGRREPAETLLEWGYLDEVVGEDALLNRAKELARFYADKPAMPAQMIKRSINVLAYSADLAAMHMETDQLLLALRAAQAGEK